MSRDRRVLIAVVVLAIVARLSTQIALGSYEHPESWEQDVIARSIADGRGFQLEYGGTRFYALVAPAFPFLLALVYVVTGGSPLGAGALQLAIGAGVALTVTVIALRSGLSRTTAAMAGVLVALHPGLVVYAAKLHPLAFDALLAALLVLLLVSLRAELSLRRIILLGLLMGTIALERITFLPTAALAVIAIGPRAQRTRRMLTVAVISVSIAAAMIAPWVVRNALVIGTPTIVTGGGLALWLGNNQVGSGGATLISGVAVIDAVPEVRDAIWGRPEVEQDATLRSLALRYIAANPLRAIRNVAQRFLTFWWAGPQTGALYPASWALLYMVYYAVAISLAALGAANLVRRRHVWPILTIGVLFASVSAAHALTYVEGRHRWTIEPEILLLTAVGLTTLVPFAWSRVVRTWTSLAR